MHSFPTPIDTPRPVQAVDSSELQYYQSNDAVGVTLIRCLGIVCLIYGTIDIAQIAAVWLIPQLRIGMSGADLAVSLITSGILMLLSIALLIGGAQLLRQPIGGRGCLLFYAYGKLAYGVWLIGYASWTISGRYPPSVPRSYVYRAILQYLAISISSSTLAVILVVLLSRRVIRRLFQSSPTR